MDCVNHPGVPSTAFCQNCGKALCQSCVRTAPGGQVLCEPCFTAWQSFQQPFVPISPGSPNPAAAAVLGLIPGVGAMYNGQFFKGLIHVVIFAVLVSLAHISGVFGIMIPAWIIYQAFEAFHTAKALRDGLPVPDPLGLNDIGSRLNLGRHAPYQPGPMPPYQAQPNQAQPNPGQPFAGVNPMQGPGNVAAPGAAAGVPNPQAPDARSWTAGGVPPPTGAPYQTPYQTPYQAPYQQGQWQSPYAPPGAGFAAGSGAGAGAGSNVPPGIPPDPSAYYPSGFWKRGAPVGAIVLIALGVLFLLDQLDLFSGRLIEYSWPVFLIGLGVWLVVRRLGESKPQGGPR
jgi:hypothetical protein